MGILKWLGLPFSLLYGIATEARNLLFESQIIKSSEFEVPTIVVGNLSVGGSGKTPMIQFLAKNLKTDYKIAVLSRGYGRKSRGFLEVTKNGTAVLMGDEPLEIKSQHPEIGVFVCEDRVMGIIEMLKVHPDIKLILLDDAFQHRKLKGSINILLTEYNRPFFKDHIMPIGRLRELRKNYKRADMVVVTKSPKGEFEKGMFLPRIDRPLFFSSMQYQFPKQVFGPTMNLEANSSCIILSGIARPKYFEEHLKTIFRIEKHIQFRDHYLYTERDIVQLVKA